MSIAIAATTPTPTAAEDFRRVFQLFAMPGACVEIRALYPNHAAEIGFFDASSHGEAAFVEHAARLRDDQRARGVYVTLNPVDPGLLSRSRNMLAAGGRGAKDTDIVGRRWLLIDCDPCREPAECSSTDAEKQAAYERAEWVSQWLSVALNWPEPILADSGNGYHLLYRIDLPADDAGLVNRALKVLSDDRGFTDNGVKVDTKVSNASRIVKLYGTIGRKGEDTPERPHRVSRLLTVPERLRVVTREQLEELAGLPTASANQHQPTRQQIADRAWKYIDRIPRSVSGQHGHDRCMEAACRLVVGFGLSPADARPLLDRWNAGCSPPWSDRELAHKLAEADRKSAEQPDRVGELLRNPGGGPVEHVGPEAEPTPGVTEAPDDPHRLARRFLAQYGCDGAGEPTLVCWRDDFWRWVSPGWRIATPAEIRADLVDVIKREFDQAFIDACEAARAAGDDPPKAARQVKRTVVENALQAVQAMRHRSHLMDQPCWLRDESGDPPAGRLLATQNGMVLMPDTPGEPVTLSPATPRLFSSNAVNYPYLPDADCPEWLRFLGTLWPDDARSVAALQEWFGYLITGDTSHHRLLMLIGPPRSGKGTIGRVLKQLIGPQNIASPTLSSLAGQFGLQGLIGKSLALIADARLSGRTDTVAVVERLLSISGEDPQDVQRKHQTTLTGIKLGVRFLLLSNELPSLPDAAGALMSRVVLLKLTESFAGREDRSLAERLTTELPGILNWAIAGLRRLRERGTFEQPISGQELLDDLEDITSPVGQFVRECCTVHPAATVSADELYRAWARWTGEQRIEPPGPLSLLARNLRSVLPRLKVEKRRVDGGRQGVYVGLGLQK